MTVCSAVSVVTGAGGLIGGHLVAALLADGHVVRGVDLKPLADWHQCHDSAENLVLDLRSPDACDRALTGAREVYNLAADMGGIGFIEANKATCMFSVLINTHLLQAATQHGLERYFFASSACVYPLSLQRTEAHPGLREHEAHPADPDGGYGWEKLFGERMCHHVMEDLGLEVRVARYHNVYGPHGAWDGGREKAPAAICRKVAEAKRSGNHEIDVWGDGEQTRSFMHVDDGVEGTRRLTRSDVREPLNVGSEEMVSVNRLVDIAEELAGIEVDRRYVLDAPQGVRGRSSDNTLIRNRLGWEPSISLRDGLARTYAWVEEEVAALSPSR